MKQRIRKIDRILKVQEHLKQEAELRALSSRKGVSRAEERRRRSIIQSMNDHETLHGLFVDVAAKRLQVLSTQASHVEKAKVDAEGASLSTRPCRRSVRKRCCRTSRIRTGRETEKKDLASILETLAEGQPRKLPVS